MSMEIKNGIARIWLNPRNGGGQGGGIEVIEVTNAADTPQGVVWYDGSTTITGTLVASNDTLNKVYLVPVEEPAEKDLFNEYITVKRGDNFVWEKYGGSIYGTALLIASTSDITVEGYAVPALTEEQITTAYNAVVKGRGCIIVDRNDNGHFLVNQADSLNGDITIEILYYNYMLVTYTLSDEEVTVTGVKFEGAKPYLSLERLEPYLFRVTFDNLPEDNGGDSIVAGGCSSFVKDKKFYRSLDWGYDNTAEFIVKTKDFEGLSFVKGLDNVNLDDDLIAQLPYRVNDGVNNYDIKVSTHILYNDWLWGGVGDKTIPITRLPFIVLSRVKSMATIATDLTGVLDNLSSVEGLDAMGYLLQVFVTDGTTSYAIVPPTEDNQPFELVDITSVPKLTNFRPVGRATVDRQDMDMQTRPTGVERFNIMPCALENLRFTKAYEAPDRLSEFIGAESTDKDSTDEELEEIYEQAHDLYLDRERDGRTWQSLHAVVYGERMETLYVQENYNHNVLCHGKTEIVLSGESGTLTAAEMSLLFNESENVAIVNDGRVFTPSNKLSTLNYRTFLNFDVAQSESVTARALYIQTSPTAANYGSWSTEDITLSGGIGIIVLG